jgi:hypothetical protein
MLGALKNLVNLGTGAFSSLKTKLLGGQIAEAKNNLAVNYSSNIQRISELRMSEAEKKDPASFRIKFSKITNDISPLINPRIIGNPEIKQVVDSHIKRERVYRAPMIIAEGPIVKKAEDILTASETKLDDALKQLISISLKYDENELIKSLESLTAEIKNYCSSALNITKQFSDASFQKLYDEDLFASDLELGKIMALNRSLTKSICKQAFSKLENLSSLLPIKTIALHNGVIHSIRAYIGETLKQQIAFMDTASHYGILDKDIMDIIFSKVHYPSNFETPLDLQNTLLLRQELHEASAGAMLLDSGGLALPSINSSNYLAQEHFDLINATILRDFEQKQKQYQAGNIEISFASAAFDKSIFNLKQFLAKGVGIEAKNLSEVDKLGKSRLYEHLSINPNDFFGDKGQGQVNHRYHSIASFSNYLKKQTEGKITEKDLGFQKLLMDSFLDDDRLFASRYIKVMYETKLLAAIDSVSDFLKLPDACDLSEKSAQIRALPWLKELYEQQKQKYKTIITEEKSEKQILAVIDEAAFLAHGLNEFGFSGDGFLAKNNIEKLGSQLLNKLGEFTDIGIMSVSLNFIRNFFNPLDRASKDLGIKESQEISLGRLIQSLSNLSSIYKDGQKSYALKRPNQEADQAYFRTLRAVNSPGFLMTEVKAVLDYVDQSSKSISNNNSDNRDHVLMSFWLLSVLTKFLAHRDKEDQIKIKDKNALNAWLNILKTSIKPEILFNETATDALKFKISMYSFARQAARRPLGGCMLSVLIKETNQHLNKIIENKDKKFDPPIPLKDLLNAVVQIHDLIDENKSSLEKLQSKGDFQEIEMGKDLIQLKDIMAKLVQVDSRTVINFVKDKPELKTIVANALLDDLLLVKRALFQTNEKKLVVMDDDQKTIDTMIKFYEVSQSLNILFDRVVLDASQFAKDDSLINLIKAKIEEIESIRGKVIIPVINDQKTLDSESFPDQFHRKNIFLEAVRDPAFAFKNHKGIRDIRWLSKNSVNTDYTVRNKSQLLVRDNDYILAA